MSNTMRMAALDERAAPVRPSWVLIAAALYLSLYAIGLALELQGTAAQVQSDLLYNIPAFIATVLTFSAARREKGRRRIGWYLVCGFLVLSQVGDWMYPIYDWVLVTDMPYPSVADVFYYAGYLAFAPAIPLLLFPDSTLRDRRWILEALIVAAVAGTLSWQFVLIPVANADGAFTLSAVVSVGYPVADLFFVTLLAIAIFASRGVFLRRTLVIAASVLALVIADTGLAFLLNAFDYDPVSNPMELGWLLSYWLLAVAAVMPAASEEESAFSSEHSSLSLVVPYLAIAPVATLMLVESLRGSPSIELIVGGMITVGLVIARQYVMLSTNLAVHAGERAGLETKLAQAAMQDPLTGVLNRAKFADVLNATIAGLSESSGQLAVVIVDLDDFSAINASVGYIAGDAFLCQHADLLKSRLRDVDVLARLDGDAFAILLRDVNSRKARTITMRLLEAVRTNVVNVDGRSIVATASAGLVAGLNGAQNHSDLLANAAIALQQAKAKGGNTACAYRHSGRNRATDQSRLQWRQRILEALDNDGFVLYGQPITSITTGEVDRYEVLIRMNGPDGPILPGAFLPIAEETGLMPAIDRWVVKRSLDILTGPDARRNNIRLAVNLSATALRDRELESAVAKALTCGRMARGGLVLEITESVAIADMALAKRFIDRLSGLGCQFALDDFGAGYSSFNHLKLLPIEHLKIDGGFIKNLSNSPLDQHLVRAIVRMARALGRRTVAEFVGDDETVLLLRELGVGYGQGFHLGRPVPLSGLLGEAPAPAAEPQRTVAVVAIA